LGSGKEKTRSFWKKQSALSRTHSKMVKLRMVDERKLAGVQEEEKFRLGLLERGSKKPSWWKEEKSQCTFFWDS